MSHLENGDGCESDMEDAPAEPRSPRKGGRRGGFIGGPHVFKVLAPDSLVASIIGKGGETRKTIEDESGAKLKISERHEYYPETNCRILVVSASDAAHIMAALEQVVSRIVGVGVEEKEKGCGKGKRPPDETETMFGKEPGEYVFRAVLPAQCSSALIGPRGARIKALRERTGAKVFVENDIHEGHQMVRLIGVTEALIQALPTVSEVMEEEMAQNDLVQWAGIMSFRDPAAGGGRRRHKGGGGGGGAGGGGGKRSRRGNSKGDERGSGKGGRKGGEERSGSGRQWSRSRSRSRDWDADGYSEASYGRQDFDGAPMETMQALADDFIPGALNMAHAVSCDLPNYRIGGLIGRKGEYINNVQRETGAQVIFNDLPKGSEATHRTMTVTGPLMAVYAAHMMMMKRFHEEEAREEAEANPPPARSSREASQVEALQSQLADLERQLTEARGEKPQSSRRKGGSKGKR